MGDTNGSLKGPKSANAKGMNGHANGIKPATNGHAVTPRRRQTQKPGPSFISRIFSMVARYVMALLFTPPSSSFRKADISTRTGS